MTVEKQFLTQRDVTRAADVLADRVRSATTHLRRPPRVYGVPRGGIPVAYLLTGYGMTVAPNAAEADVIVDDILDSGATRERYRRSAPGAPFLTLFEKGENWLVFPWEVTDHGNDRSQTDTVVRMLEMIGEDPTREGLLETPARVVKAWGERFSGYGQDPAAVLKTFDDGAEGVDEMVVLTNLPVVSKCEHHIEDIIGVAHVGYIPDKRIVGLSKIQRLVEVFARRLQVQERLTNQIADALFDHLQPIGVGVVIDAAHHCMVTRGVRVHGSTTTTSALRGTFKSEASCRSEFLQLVAATRK